MTILKGVPSILSPELLSVLARMGHGDELVLADANFPSESVAASTTLGHAIRYDATAIPELLTAIMVRRAYFTAPRRARLSPSHATPRRRSSRSTPSRNRASSWR